MWTKSWLRYRQLMNEWMCCSINGISSVFSSFFETRFSSSTILHFRSSRPGFLVETSTGIARAENERKKWINECLGYHSDTMSSSWIPEGITREEIMIAYLSNGQTFNNFDGFKGSRHFPLWRLFCFDGL
jgi:hypothetical protein